MPEWQSGLPGRSKTVRMRPAAGVLIRLERGWCQGGPARYCRLAWCFDAGIVASLYTPNSCAVLRGFARMAPIRGWSEGGRSEECWPAADILFGSGPEAASSLFWGRECEVIAHAEKVEVARSEPVGAVVAAMAAAPLKFCGSGPAARRMPSVTKNSRPVPCDSQCAVCSGDFETVWNKTVAVVDKYFDLAV